MGLLDLDAEAAQRAAKRETNGQHPEPMTFRGETFELPIELPWLFSRALTRVGRLEEQIDEARVPPSASKAKQAAAAAKMDTLGRQMIEALEQAATALIGEDGLERFIRLGATRADVVALINGGPQQIAAISAGESPASDST